MTRTVLAFLTISLSANLLFAEGSRDVTPRTTNESTISGTNSNNDWVGYLQHDDGQNSLSFLKTSSHPNFDERHRMYVRLLPNDTLFYGVRRRDAGGQDLIITMKYDDGISGIVGTTLQSTVLSNGSWAGTLAQQQGVIFDESEVNTGPRFASGYTLPSGGYDALVYVNNTGDTIDVWFEFLRGNETLTGGNSQRTTYDIWDFTVRNNGEKPGRLYSKNWSFQANSGNNVLSRDFQFYVAIPNSVSIDTYYIKEIDLSGTQPWGLIFKCNSNGTNAAGDYKQQRKSQNNNNSDPEYDIFVNHPDFNLYASTQLPQYSISYSSFCKADATGGWVVFTYFSDNPGYAQIILDIDGGGYNPGGVDVLLEEDFQTAGFNQIIWDGNDGLGTPVAPGTTINNTFQTGLFSPIHFPLWDVEGANDGFKIRNIRPGINKYDKLFWNDSNLTSNWNGTPLANTLGEDSQNGAHVWSGNSGNNRLVNTWSYGRIVEENNSITYDYTCDKDGDLIDDKDDLDADNDGILNSVESAGDDPFGDHDADNIPNYVDIDYTHTNGTFTDVNEDAVNDLFDADLDGIIDALDLDSDNDGIADVIEAGGSDPDGDGIVGTGAITDNNNNGWDDATEASPLPSPDTDADGVKDFFDLDSDNDGLLDNVESQPVTSYVPPTGTDTDSDGIDDAYDPDQGGVLTDGAFNTDGVSAPTGTFTDIYPNHLDIDSDNDGIADIIEAQPTVGMIHPTGNDADGDGLDDAFDLDNGGTTLIPEDTDNDVDPDYLDKDSDADGLTDFDEAHDTDNDGTANFFPLNSDTDGDGMLDPNGVIDRFDQFNLNSPPVSPSGVNSDNDGNEADDPFEKDIASVQPYWRDGQTIVWDGSSWSGGSGSSGEPDDGTNDGFKTAIIKAGSPAVLTSQTKLTNIVIANDAELIVDNTCLEITGDVTTLGAGKFTLRSTSEIEYGQYKGPEVENAEAQMVLNENGWHHMSIPIANKTVADIITENPTMIDLIKYGGNMFWYNTNVYGAQDLGHGQGDDYSHAWGKWFVAEFSDEFDHTRAYNLYISDDFGGAPSTISVTGTLNNGNYLYATSDKYYGWNLVPNPYPTIIDWEEVIEDFDNNGTTADHFTLSFHVWDPANENFAVYNGVLGAGVGTGSSPASYEGAEPGEIDEVAGNTRYISPFQSFWVERSDALEESTASSVAPTYVDLEMKNSHRVLCESKKHFKTTSQQDNIRLLVSSNKNDYKDEAVLVFDHNLSYEYDEWIDTKKLFSTNNSVVQLYSIIDGNALVFNGIPYSEKMERQPLGLRAKNGHEVTVEMIKHPETWAVILEDLKTGEVFNLNERNATVKADENFASHRFNLWYAMDKDQIIEHEILYKIFGYVNGNNIVIDLENINWFGAEVEIYNLNGVLLNSAVAQESIVQFSNNFSDTFIIIRVSVGGRIYTVKMVK